MPRPLQAKAETVIAWFAEMIFAYERRDVERAAVAKRQLGRLGWPLATPRTERRLNGCPVSTVLPDDGGVAE